MFYIVILQPAQHKQMTQNNENSLFSFASNPENVSARFGRGGVLYVML